MAYRLLILARRHCERHGRYNIQRLIERYGADMGLPQLMATLAVDCPRQKSTSIYDRCGFHLPEGVNTPGRSVPL
jgi:hypothetical protein